MSRAPTASLGSGSTAGEGSAPNSPDLRCSLPSPHRSLTPPWPPASAAAAGAARSPVVSLDAGCKSPLRREQLLISPLSGSMGAGPAAANTATPPCRMGACAAPRNAGTGSDGVKVTPWSRGCSGGTRGPLPRGLDPSLPDPRVCPCGSPARHLPAPVSSLPTPARHRFPDLMGFFGTSQCPSGEDGSGMVPGGTGALVRVVGTRAHAGVWLGQRRRLPGDLDLPPATDPGKGAGWGLSFTYGSSTTSSSGLMPDPGVQLMLWDFSARALPHQPAGVGDLGDHPPFPPCGPREPPRQSSGLRGRTCGTGDRIAATPGGLGAQGSGEEKGWRHKGLGTGDVEGWARGGTERREHAGEGTQGDRVGEHAQGMPKCGTASRRGHLCLGWDGQGTGRVGTGIVSGCTLGNIAQEGTPSKQGLGGVPREWG